MMLNLIKASDAAEKLAALHKLQVLDSQYEVFYNTVNKLAALICDVPVALITLADDENIWINSEIGNSGITQIPRESAFCSWVLNDEFHEVTNISLNINRYCHPLIEGASSFMFFAGAPLKLPMGEVIGTLCVFDIKPKRMTIKQKTMLIGLADIVAKALVVKNHMVGLL